MDIKNQVNNKELGEKLKELGVKQESFFVWFHMSTEWEIVGKFPSISDLYYPAYTVAELGEMLKGFPYIQTYFDTDESGWTCTDVDEYLVQNEKTEADARARLLVHLLENDLIIL